MRRRLLVAALTLGLLGVAAPASGGTTWACGGVKLVAGVCLDNPLEGVRLPALPLLGG